MSDEYFGAMNRKTQLTSWVTGQMLKGAGYAAAVVVGFGVIFAVIWAVGLTLPPESKLADDPNTWSTQ